MNWETLKNSFVFKLAIGLFAFVVLFFVFNEVVVQRTTARVIQKLQKQYSPSPYGPGLNPDKVDPDALRKKVALPTEELKAPMPKKDWNVQWEELRQKN